MTKADGLGKEMEEADATADDTASVPPTDSGGGEPAIPTLRLSCTLVGRIDPTPTDNRWLVEGFWTAHGVGIVGGTPKTGKTWLVLDVAVSVASGTPALAHFPVLNSGPVMMFPAEDNPHAIRDRVEALCLSRGLDVNTLPLHVITATSLHLDNEEDRKGLEDLLEAFHPRLLILDPLVRVHSGDENYAGHIAEILGYLRGLQRRFSCAIIVTHHVSKRGNVQPGQALRGSSDLHAWGDSNAYLQKQKDGSVLLTLEHRSASSPDPIALELVSQPGHGARFQIVPILDGEDADDDERARSEPARGHRVDDLPLDERVTALLRDAVAPISQARMRKVLRVRNAELTLVLHALRDAGQVQHLGRMGGWQLARSAPKTTALPNPPEGAAGALSCSG